MRDVVDEFPEGGAKEWLEYERKGITALWGFPGCQKVELPGHGIYTKKNNVMCHGEDTKVLKLYDS